MATTFKPFFLFFLLLFLCGGCFSSVGQDSRITVAVAVEPLAFLCEFIGGSRVHTVVLVPPGKEPEHYQATPEKIAAVSRCRILFCTGMPFEETLLPKLQANAQHLKIVDLRSGLKLRTLELHHRESGESHTHGGVDPHIWFAPSALKTEAGTMLAALIEIDADGAEHYRQNYEQLLERIGAVQEELAAKLASQKGQTVYVFHPSYGYFCDEFGLEQRAIEYEGKTPKPQQLAALAAQAKQERRPPLIFVQPEFNQGPAQALAEAVGGKIAVHSALERDVLKSMQHFAEMLNVD